MQAYIINEHYSSGKIQSYRMDQAPINVLRSWLNSSEQKMNADFDKKNDYVEQVKICISLKEQGLL